MNKLFPSGLLSQAIVNGSCFALCASLAGVAAGQSSQGTPPGVPSIPGLTVLQQPSADTVQSVCFVLVGINPPAPTPPYPPDPNGSLTQRLSNSCTKMVVSSLGNQGIFPPDLQSFNLQISNDQLRTAVQAIAPVQANAQKQMSTEAVKASAISSRLLNVRGGSRGFVAGLNGQDLKSAGASQASGTGLDGATGGAASADSIDGPWGGFVNVGYSWGNVDQTTLQDSYNYGSFNVLAGADYRVSDSFVVGAAFSYSDTNSDYDSGLGKVKAQTTGVVGYATYYVNDMYVDGLLAYGSVDYDTTRNIVVPSNNPAAKAINASATANPKGDQWSAAIGVGRNYAFGTTTVTPSARLGYIQVKNKAFSEYEPVEGLGLAVNERTIKSLQTALGAKVSGVWNTASGVFGPYASAYWMHEFDNGAESIVSKYVADPSNQFFAIPTAGSTSNYAILALGSTATFTNSFSGFLQFTAAVGLRDETFYSAVLGIRKQF